MEVGLVLWWFRFGNNNKKKMLPFFCILLVFLLHVKFEFIQLNLDKFV